MLLFCGEKDRIAVAVYIFLLFLVSSALAEIRGNFSLDVRYRYEFLHNFNKKFYGRHSLEGKSSDGFLLQRIRAGVDFFHGNLHLALWFQDSRALTVVFH